MTGQCPCKEQVEGRRCDTCRAGFWKLDTNSAKGCEGIAIYDFDVHPGTSPTLSRMDPVSFATNLALQGYKSCDVFFDPICGRLEFESKA